MNPSSIISELAKLRSSSTFLCLSGYQNEHGEVADYNIVFHISYENALTKSIKVIEGIAPSSELQRQAKEEVLTSFSKSLAKCVETTIEELDDAYTRFFNDDGSCVSGVKVHTVTNTLHLFGLVVSKRVIIAGTYPSRNKKPLTVEKDKLRSLTPLGKFRQFIISPDRVERIAVQGLSILPQDYI